MDQEPSTAPLRPGWAEPAALIDLMGSLKRAGHRIDVRHYLAVQDLVLGLSASGVPFDDRDRFVRMLGPLVCSTPEEQAAFPRRFRDWAEGLSPPQVEQARAIAPTLSETVRQGSRGFSRIAGIVGVVLVLAFLAWLAAVTPGAIKTITAEGHGLPPELDSEPGVESLVALGKLIVFLWRAAPGVELSLMAAVVGTAIALIVGWRLWWRHQARVFLEQRAASAPPESDIVSPRVEAFPASERLAIAEAGRFLRRRSRAESSALNTAQTINATLAAGNWLTPIYAERLITPEHLVLVDRSAPGDHQARSGRALCDGLHERQVAVSVYYFDETPQLCFAERSGQPMRLDDILARRSYASVTVIADVSVFHHAATGDALLWVKRLPPELPRYLLTPEPLDLWWQAPKRLQAWRIFPATPTGLVALAREMKSTGRRPHHKLAKGIPLAARPRALSEFPQRWLERDPPSRVEFDELLAELDAHLGPEGLLWLSALAIYPTLDWNITTALGRRLRTDSGEPLASPQRLALLSRLPWLRHGRMPIWLRAELVNRLSRNAERQIRGVLTDVLSSAVEVDEGARFLLQVAREHPLALRALSRAVFERLGRRDPSGPTQDYVFRSFMSGRRLAFRLPERVSELLAGSKRASVRRAGRVTELGRVLTCYVAFALGCSAWRYGFSIQGGVVRWEPYGWLLVGLLQAIVGLALPRLGLRRILLLSASLALIGGFAVGWTGEPFAPGMTRLSGSALLAVTLLNLLASGAAIGAAFGAAVTFKSRSGHVAVMAFFLGARLPGLDSPLVLGSLGLLLLVLALVPGTSLGTLPSEVSSSEPRSEEGSARSRASVLTWTALALAVTGFVSGFPLTHWSDIAPGPLAWTLLVRYRNPLEKAGWIVFGFYALSLVWPSHGLGEALPIASAVYWVRAPLLARVAALRNPRMGVAACVLAIFLGIAAEDILTTGLGLATAERVRHLLEFVALGLLFLANVQHYPKWLRPRQWFASEPREPEIRSGVARLPLFIVPIGTLVSGGLVGIISGPLMFTGSGNAALGFLGALVCVALGATSPGTLCVAVTAMVLSSSKLGWALVPLSLGAWHTLYSLRLARELASISPDFPWWAVVIPGYGAYLEHVIVPREVAHIRRSLNLVERRRRLWYLFFPHSTWDAEMNEIAWGLSLATVGTETRSAAGRRLNRI